ncbi:hypothetical protein Acr_17g0010930 [Actinidia rufa]|uniref:Bulb-type lectin domain-containing protein n=1 Tax=Actinidia rufa TaxID=165716 RepID=A0A7J0G407_9ERIC|nr:hypothetical protein Acr_17g0010930 [Actinidia rufa]
MKISTGTVVWAAKREIPLADTTGVLKVVDPGILVLVNGTNHTIWSTNLSSSAHYPRMKLGKNLVTGQEWYLSSWKRGNDPARGEYTYGLDIHGYPQIVLSKSSTDLFRSGPWNGVRFSGPLLRPNLIYKYGVFLKTMRGRTIYLTVPQDSCDTCELCGPYGSCNVDKSPAWILYEEGRSLELIDEHTRDSCCLAAVLRSVHVGLLCVQQCLEDRPSMSSVVLMLGSEGDLPQPKQPGFFTGRSLLDAGGLSSEGAVYSANEITISLLDAR